MTTAGEAYSNTLTPASGFEFANRPLLGGVEYGSPSVGDGDGEPGDAEPATVGLYCTVVMDDDNITAEAFDIETGEISIDEVTGNIVIVTEADTVPTT